MLITKVVVTLHGREAENGTVGNEVDAKDDEEGNSDGITEVGAEGDTRNKSNDFRLDCEDKGNDECKIAALLIGVLVGLLEGINIEDIRQRIMYYFNFKNGSRLEIHSISADNIATDSNHYYFLNDASPI